MRMYETKTKPKPKKQHIIRLSIYDILFVFSELEYVILGVRIIN